MMFAVSGAAQAALQAALVDISIEPAASTVNVTDSFAVNIWLRDSAQTNVQNVAVNFGWDESFLQLDSIDEGTGYDWPSWNTFDLPGDPDSLIVATHVGSTATTDFLFATLNFTALAQTASTDITIYASGPIPTAVFIGTTNVTGSLTGGSVEIVPEPATICLLGIGALSLLRRRKK